MTSSSLVEALRAQLNARRDVLKQMGWLYDSAHAERAWWRTEPNGAAAVDCLWMTGTAPSPDDMRRQRVRLRDGAEALVLLVLLNALARVDYRAFVKTIESMWTPNARRPARETVDRDPMPRRRIVGYAYHVFASDDLAPVCEQDIGVHCPSGMFGRDLTRPTRELPLLVQEDRTARSIPVRIHIALVSDRAVELARSLRQIRHAVIAQRLLAQAAQVNEAVHAASITRFEIVEVCFENPSCPPATTESLECLAKLTELGVRVLTLPAIYDLDTSAEQLLSLTNSLRILMPSQRGLHTSFGVECFLATDDLPVVLMPAFFSAAQVSRHVKSVEVNVQFNPHTLAHNYTLDNMIALWKWAMYSLFSRHADHDIEFVKLHVKFLDQQVLHAIEDVLRAENPLDILYNIAFDDDYWIMASRFYIEESSGDNRTVFHVLAPLAVRVIAKVEREGRAWWSVFLPGCGKAWVKDGDTSFVSKGHARLVSSRDDIVIN